MRKSSYWEVVLGQFQKRKYIQNGLTLPFLIGVHDYFRVGPVPITIKELILQMVNNDKPVSIIFCPGIKEYIFSLIDDESMALFNKLGDKIFRLKNLLATDGSVDHFEGIDGLISVFEEKYMAIIEQGIFSKNIGIWGTFNGLDIQQLESIRGSLIE